MSKLVLRFENNVLKEVKVGSREVSIGRSPESAIAIDNPAVSHIHARIFTEEGRLMLEDFGSLNGTFVNGQRVQLVTIKPGDVITVGKHTITVVDSSEPLTATTQSPGVKPPAPKLSETVMLDTRQRREFLQRVAASGERSQLAPQRLRVPTLVVQSGKTEQKEYLITDKLTVIGKSPMATVKLKGWFVPKAAAQITRRDDNSYYIGPADRKPKVNGQEVSHPTKLAEGDLIEVANVQMTFIFRD